MLEVIQKSTSLDSIPGRRIIVPFQVNIGGSPKAIKRSDDELDFNSDTNDLVELQTKLRHVK